jgi:hypothetical protein
MYSLWYKLMTGTQRQKQRFHYLITSRDRTDHFCMWGQVQRYAVLPKPFSKGPRQAVSCGQKKFLKLVGMKDKNTKLSFSFPSQFIVHFTLTISNLDLRTSMTMVNVSLIIHAQGSCPTCPPCSASNYQYERLVYNIDI